MPLCGSLQPSQRGAEGSSDDGGVLRLFGGVGRDSVGSAGAGLATASTAMSDFLVEGRVDGWMEE